MYVHRKYESKELIDILSSLGFACNYSEVRRVNAALNVRKKQNVLSMVLHNSSLIMQILMWHL